MIVDSPVAEFARTLYGAALIVSISTGFFGATLFWARRPGHRDRGAVLIAGVVGAVLTAGLNLVFGSMGVWRSTEYTLPVAVLGSFLVLIASALAWVVAFYRWLSRRRDGRIVAVALLGGIAALVLVVDQFALSQGYIAFGGGYTGWMDALVAVAVFLAPVGVDNLLSRQRPS